MWSLKRKEKELLRLINSYMGSLILLNTYTHTHTHSGACTDPHTHTHSRG